MKTNNALSLTGGGRTSQRDPAPEICRVALMFGICLLHCVTQGGHCKPFLANILLSCVDGFAFITGWYGLRFRPSKPLRLYATALWCGTVALFIGWKCGVYALAWDEPTAKLLHGMLVNPWFLNAYVFMMLLAPLVDAAIDRLPARLLPSAILPFFLLSFGWSFGKSLPLVGRMLPDTVGLGAYTGLSLLSVYVLARLCRRFDVGRFFTWPRAAVALLALWGITGLGFGEYSSLFAAALSAMVFFVFLRLPWPNWAGRVALWLGPTMFAVYLIHSNRIGFWLIRQAEDLLIDAHGWPILAAYAIVAPALFLACVAIDLPRRLLVRLTRPLWRPLFAALDTLYLRLAPDR